MTDQFDDYVGQYSDSVKQFEAEVNQRRLMPHFREDIEKLKNIDWHSARVHGDMFDPISKVYDIIDPIYPKLGNLSQDAEQHLLDLLGKIRACADQMPEKFKHIKVGYGVPNPVKKLQ